MEEVIPTPVAADWSWKKAAPRPKKTGPSVQELVVKAVAASKERRGMTLDEVKKALAAGGYDVEKNKHLVESTIKRLVAKGTLVEIKTFKIAKKPKRSPRSVFGVGLHNCGHREDAGVICTGPQTSGSRLLLVGIVAALLLLLMLLLIGCWLMWRRKFRKHASKTNNTDWRGGDAEDFNTEVSVRHQSTDDDYMKDPVAVSNIHKHACNDAVCATTEPEKTKEYPNPGRRAVEGQSDVDYEVPCLIMSKGLTAA